MNRFQTLTRDDAPAATLPALQAVEAKYGFVPNLMKGLALSPESLASYLSLSESFEASSLAPEEQQIVLLAAARAHECEYCTSAHSVTAGKTRLDSDAIEKIRNREALPDTRHEALRVVVDTLIQGNGAVPQDVWSEFEEAGFTARNSLEVVLGVTLKAMTDAVNDFLDTPLDEAFQDKAWSKSDAQQMAHA